MSKSISRWKVLIFASAAIVSPFFATHALASQLGPHRVSTGQAVLAPMPHIRFCAEHPGQCIATRGRLGRMTQAATLRMLDQVNRDVNRSIAPLDDRMHMGLRDRWQIGVRRGDCEDYALEKRRRLLQMGWASGDILVAVVTTRGNVLHAVLVVRVGGTDVVLDNLTDRILRWRDTGHRFEKIQSSRDPRRWLSVSPVPRA